MTFWLHLFVFHEFSILAISVGKSYNHTTNRIYWSTILGERPCKERCNCIWIHNKNNIWSAWIFYRWVCNKRNQQQHGSHGDNDSYTNEILIHEINPKKTRVKISILLFDATPKMYGVHDKYIKVICDIVNSR